MTINFHLVSRLKIIGQIMVQISLARSSNGADAIVQNYYGISISQNTMSWAQRKQIHMADSVFLFGKYKPISAKNQRRNANPDLWHGSFWRSLITRTANFCRTQKIFRLCHKTANYWPYGPNQSR